MGLDPRYTLSSPVVHQGAADASPNSILCNPVIGGTTSSMAAVTCHPMNVEVLDSVPELQEIKGSKCKKRLATGAKAIGVDPVHQRPKSLERTKRRKTEFFSLSEVEALVQKVEELGTGRWQKIKEEAFGKESRRTYMDVKDKWRSLVKTAKRPADERRGVLLPQGLLDRVLAVEARMS